MEHILNLMPEPHLWLVLALCGVLVGLAKTSVAAIGTLFVPIMAMAFGAKNSTGILLPMLCFADLCAIIYYRRSCSWNHLFRLLTWAVVGLFVGIFIDSLIPPQFFRYLLAFSIFIGAVVLIYNEIKGSKTQANKSKWVLSLYGVAGGFATMIGNAAGPILSVYLLSVRMPKLAFVGTSAWFFMAINYIKLPLQIWVWDNITLDSLIIVSLMIPFILLGAVLGIYLIKIIPEQSFRKIVIWITLLSAIVLLF